MKFLQRLSTLFSSSPTLDEKQVRLTVKAFLATETWEETLEVLKQNKDILLTDVADRVLVSMMEQVKYGENEPPLQQLETYYLQLHLTALRKARVQGISAPIHDTSGTSKGLYLAAPTHRALTAFFNASGHAAYHILEEEQALLLKNRTDNIIGGPIPLYSSLGDQLTDAHEKEAWLKNLLDREKRRTLLRRAREIGIPAAWRELDMPNNAANEQSPFQNLQEATQPDNTSKIKFGSMTVIYREQNDFIAALYDLQMHPSATLHEHEKYSKEKVELPRNVAYMLEKFLSANFWQTKRSILEQEQTLLLTESVKKYLDWLIELVETSSINIKLLHLYLFLHSLLLRHAHGSGITSAWESLASPMNAIQNADATSPIPPCPPELQSFSADIAQLYKQPQDLKQAIVIQREIIQRMEAGVSYRYLPFWVAIQCDLANALLVTGEGLQDDYNEASDRLYKALEVVNPKTFPYEYAALQETLGKMYMMRKNGSRQDNIEEAISCYSNSLSTIPLWHISPTLSVPIPLYMFSKEYAKRLSSLADAYRFRVKGVIYDNLKQAATYLSMLLSLTEPTSYRYAMTSFQLGVIHKSIGDLQNGYGINRPQEQNIALTHLQNALVILTKDAFPLNYANVQFELGRLYSERLEGNKAENIEQALPFLQEAQRICATDPLSEFYGQIHRSLGHAYIRRLNGNRYENLHKSLYHFRQSLKALTSQASPSGFLSAQLDIAWLAFHFLSTEAALCENLVEVREAYEIARDALVIAGRFQAELDLQENDEQSRILLRKEGHLLDINVNLAWCFWQLGDLQRAVTALERGRANSLFEALSIRDISQANVCSTHTKDFAEALRQLQAAYLKDDFRLRHTTRATFLSIREDIRRHCDPKFLSFEPDYHDIALAAPTQAIVYLAATEKGGMAFIIPPSKGYSGTDIHPPLALSLPHLTSQLVNSWHQRYDDNNGVIFGGFSFMVQGLGSLILKHWNNHFGNSNVPPSRLVVPLRDIAGQLPDTMGTLRQALQSLITHWIEREEFYAKGNTQERKESERLRILLNLPFNEALISGKLDRELAWRFQKAEIERLLPELSEVIMRPLRQQLNEMGLENPAQSIALIPCGRLSSLPLHAAFVPDGYGEAVPFLETCVLTYQPSARVLAATQKAAQKLPTDGPVIAVAVGNSASHSLASLPYAEEEVRLSVKQARKKKRAGSIAIVGNEATLGRVGDVLQKLQREKKEGSGAWIEVAGHGYTDVTDPDKCYMVLAGNDLLTLTVLRQEQLLMGVRCFSAIGCTTGVVETKNAPDELTSFASGILQAGAASAIATLWSVSDQMCFYLMLRFHQIMLERTVSPTYALREATCWLRKATIDDLQNLQRACEARMDFSIPTGNTHTLGDVRGMTFNQLPDAIRGVTWGRTKTTEVTQKAENEDAQQSENSDKTPFAHPVHWASVIIYGS